MVQRGALLALAGMLAAGTLSAQDSLGTEHLKTGREKGVLRVCADPDNLPASNLKHEGYEVRIAELVAKTWGWSTEYAWWPVRRGFFSRALNGGYCDVAITAPSGLDMAGVTGPYFRSGYFIVYRKDRGWNLHSLADTAFRHLRIGVHLLNSDAENTPPAMAMSKFGVVGNLVGFPTNYSDLNRPEDIILAVEHDSIDVAIAWGPAVGYWVKQSTVPLVMNQIEEKEVDGFPFVFDMGMGVRRRDRGLRDSLQAVIDAKYPEMQQILKDYGVPLLPLDRAAGASGKGN